MERDSQTDTVDRMKLSDYIGETSSYDKKLMLERDNPVSWLKSVSAFANTLGGNLLFGVSDDGELVGLADAEKDAEDIRRGSGFGKIIDAYKAASKRVGREVAPTFSSDAANFFLTLPNLNYGLSATSGTLKSSAKSSAKSSGKSSAKRANTKSEKSARIILRAIRSDTNVSVRELQLRTHLSNSGVRKIIAQLKVAGSVRRVGGTNGGHWEVVGS